MGVRRFPDFGPVRRAILPAFAALSALPGHAIGQHCAAAEHEAARRLAEQYAPAVFFAPGETSFPTLPWFPALEGRGFQSPATIAQRDPGRPAPGSSWTRIDSIYRRRVEARGGPPFRPYRPAVFYEVTCLSSAERGRLFSFLRNDPQAFKRTGLGVLFNQGIQDAEFIAVTFYLYYTRDDGLQGHPQDVERVVVFAPWRPNERVTLSRLTQQRVIDTMDVAAFRRRLDSVPAQLAVLVGTGHSGTTPNNVLVLAGEEARRLTHPAIIVERGGHSSAPDKNFDANFHPGMDINWNLAGSVWGTRDVQAIAGMAYLGAYKSWMTLPRVRGTFATVYPSEAGEASKHFEDGILDTLVRRGVLRHRADADPYLLLSAGRFRELLALADSASARGRATPEEVRAARRIVDGELVPLLAPASQFVGWQGLPDDSVAALLPALAIWNEPMEAAGAGTPAASAPWVHGEYGRVPIGTLKGELFRPTWEGFGGVRSLVSHPMVHLGHATGDGGFTTQIGLVVPVLPVLGLIAVPGVLEVYFGTSSDLFLGTVGGKRRKARWGAFAFLFDRQYKSAISWYLGLDQVPGRRFLVRDTLPVPRPLVGGVPAAEPQYDENRRVGNLALAGGLSLMPAFVLSDKGAVLRFLSTRLRVRLGLQIYERDWRPALGAFEWRTVLYYR